MNSAPENYQHIIIQVVSEIDGVQNIADDLIVHGKIIEEHDQSLHKVLQRLEEKNLTLNPTKCEFCMEGGLYGTSIIKIWNWFNRGECLC